MGSFGIELVKNGVIGFDICKMRVITYTIIMVIEFQHKLFYLLCIVFFKEMESRGVKTSSEQARPERCCIKNGDV